MTTLKLFPLFAAAALTIGTAPAMANSQDDFQACLKLKAQLNELQAGMGDKSTSCERVRDWVNPADRAKSNGGRTAMIRKCEAIWKPQLKSQRSYSYEGADLIAQGGNKIKVVVNYTATNSFNARVPGAFTCNFGA